MSPSAMLQAIALAEKHIAGGMAPLWAVGRAARLHAVDADELAARVLTKLIECRRARDAQATMKSGDAALERGPAKSLAPRQRRPRREDGAR